MRGSADEEVQVPRVRHEARQQFAREAVLQAEAGQVRPLEHFQRLDHRARIAQALPSPEDGRPLVAGVTDLGVRKRSSLPSLSRNGLLPLRCGCSGLGVECMHLQKEEHMEGSRRKGSKIL